MATSIRFSSSTFKPIAVFVGAFVAGAAGADASRVSAVQGPTPVENRIALRKGFTCAAMMGGDGPALTYYLHLTEFMPHALVGRQGPVRVLASQPDPTVGKIVAKGSLPEMSLDQLVAEPKADLQGFIVMHRGKIAYEKYPAMKPSDRHVWMSLGKTIVSLLVGQLESEGKIDVQQPIETYLPELSTTQWKGVPVVDVLDMASGMEVVEDAKIRSDPSSLVVEFLRAELGEPSATGQHRTPDQILDAARKLGPSGRTFDYGSMNTQMLVRLIETVTHTGLDTLFAERVWSRIGAEGDAFIGLTPQGAPVVHGLVSSTLRDLARFGLLFTPSQKVVTASPIVTQALLGKIQKGGRPEIYDKGFVGQALQNAFHERPRANAYQWDAIFDDGDFFKSGSQGQGLYISPSRDLVIAWFATSREKFSIYARAIAKHFPVQSRR